MNRDDRKIRFGLWYDFRNPSSGGKHRIAFTAETLDQIAWGESHGFDDVWLSEHHFIEDGYLPSILPVAAAIAARTKRIRIASGVLLMPFHNPVRLAEDIAVVDVISGGRFELGVGVGFQARRVRRLRCVLQGARCANKSITRNHSSSAQRRDGYLQERFLQLQERQGDARTVQKPHPPIWLGGFTAAALRRAARYGDGFTVPGATRDVYDQYVAELKKQNRPTENIRFASAVWCLIVSNDPEKTFAEAADHIIYQANNYSAWLSAAGLSPLSEHLRDREQLRQSGLLQVVDPDRAVSMIRDFTNNVPVTHFYSWTLPPGLPPRWAQTHLELFASKVIPAFR